MWRARSASATSRTGRADKRPLAVPTSLTADDYSIGYAALGLPGVGGGSHQRPRGVVPVKQPVQLLLADQTEGMFRIESASLTVLEFADNGKPSVVDVSLTLKRASDATVRVGLVKRVRAAVKGFAKRTK